MLKIDKHKTTKVLTIVIVLATFTALLGLQNQAPPHKKTTKPTPTPIVKPPVKALLTPSIDSYEHDFWANLEISKNKRGFYTPTIKLTPTHLNKNKTVSPASKDISLDALGPEYKDFLPGRRKCKHC